MMGRVLDGAFVWIAKVGCIESRRKSAAPIVITRQPVSSNYRRNYNQVPSCIVVADFFVLKQRIRDRWNANVLFTFDIKSTIWFDRSSNTLLFIFSNVSWLLIFSNFTITKKIIEFPWYRIFEGRDDERGRVWRLWSHGRYERSNERNFEINEIVLQLAKVFSLVANSNSGANIRPSGRSCVIRQPCRNTLDESAGRNRGQQPWSSATRCDTQLG